MVCGVDLEECVERVWGRVGEEGAIQQLILISIAIEIPKSEHDRGEHRVRRRRRRRRCFHRRRVWQSWIRETCGTRLRRGRRCRPKLVQSP